MLIWMGQNNMCHMTWLVLPTIQPKGQLIAFGVEFLCEVWVNKFSNEIINCIYGGGQEYKV